MISQGEISTENRIFWCRNSYNLARALREINANASRSYNLSVYRFDSGCSRNTLLINMIGAAVQKNFVGLFGIYPPDITPRNKTPSLMIIFNLSTLFFSTSGHPYGPRRAHIRVLTRISFYIVFIWFILVNTLFLYDFRWSYTLFLILLTYFENNFYTYFITFLEFSRIILHVLRPKNSAYYAKFTFRYV